MMTLDLNNPAIMALGWTLVHSLWITLLIALVVRAFWHFISPQKASYRYNIALGGMLATLVGAIATFSIYFRKYQQTTFVSSGENMDEGLSGSEVLIDQLMLQTTSSSTFESILETLESNIPFLVLAWLAGTFLMGFRLMGSWWYLRQLEQKGIQSPPQDWNHLFSELCTKMGIRRPVRLMISKKVTEPITLRHLKPIILFPVGLMTQLTMEQVEVILLHELAHIKRWDYLVNWFQSLLELLFFYHPAVWWLSAKVREAREHCCDDLVLQADHSKQRMLYAQTLTQLTAFSIHSKTKLAMSLSGNKNTFTHRVKRLFGQADERFDWQKPMLSGLIILFVLLVGMFNAPNTFAENTELNEATLEEALTLVAADTIPKTINFRSHQQDNPNREQAILFKGKLVGFGKATLAKIMDSNKTYTMKEIVSDWAMLEYGEPARFGAVNLIPNQEEPEVKSVESVKIEYQKLEAPIVDSMPIGSQVKIRGVVSEKPLYVIDGKIVDVRKDPLTEINAEEIATINVLKGTAAKEKYGEKGNRGVVEINTKEGNWTERNATYMDIQEDMAYSVFKIGDPYATEKVDPLFVMDNKVLGKQSKVASRINKEKIAEVRFAGPTPELKAKYGDQANEGVVFIVSKSLAATAKIDHKINLNPKFNPNIEIKGDALGDPLLIVDGKEVGRGKELLDDMDTENIATVNVFKGKSAIERYGDKGKNGVVEVITKQGKAKQQQLSSSVYAPDNPKNLADYKFSAGPKDKLTDKDPLIVLNGKAIGLHSKVGATILAQKEGLMFVYKAHPIDELIKKFGPQAKEGVLIVNTKEEVEKEEENTKITIRAKDEKDPLYVIDGKVLGHGKDKIAEIDPKTIKTINVIKGESAILKYGDQAKNGVVEIVINGVAKVEPEKKVDLKADHVELTYDDKKEAGNLKNYLVFIDGAKKGFWQEVKDKVDKENLKSIKMFEQKYAPEGYQKYGEDIMLIETKQNTISKVEKVEKAESIDLKFSTKEGDESKQPLFVVDGVEMKKGEKPLKELKPEDIDRIEVLKGKSATTLYGDKGKDGVVLIYTKRGAKKAKKEERAQARKDKKQPVVEGTKTEKESPVVVGKEVPQTQKASVNNALQAEIAESLKAFPNPFNSEINIGFVLPEEARTEVSIFDANGRLIKRVAQEVLPAGSHRFTWDSGQVPSGNYTVMIKTDNAMVSKTVVKK